MIYRMETDWTVVDSTATSWLKRSSSVRFKYVDELFIGFSIGPLIYLIGRLKQISQTWNTSDCVFQAQTCQTVITSGCSRYEHWAWSLLTNPLILMKFYMRNKWFKTDSTQTKSSFAMKFIARTRRRKYNSLVRRPSKCRRELFAINNSNEQNDTSNARNQKPANGYSITFVSKSFGVDSIHSQ